MIKSWQHLRLTVILAVGGTFATTTSVLAQSITVDGTLSPAQTLNGPTYTIPQSVGQTVGSNLFHSFGIFNLNAGERANFRSAGDIRNILSRVTGGSASMIDGLIFTNSPNVNLFLINPSGIVFGPNARLDVGGSTRGSFVATTLDALVWSNGSQFSATNPGGANSLLTIVGDPSGFLSTLRTPRPIDVNRSTLRASQGQSLLLLGGNVNLDGSNLSVGSPQGGRIELGAVAEPGNVGLSTNGNILSLNFPENLARGDVSLTNGASVNVTASGGGNISINAQNIDISNNSKLSAGIRRDSKLIGSIAGDIILNATEGITIRQTSVIENLVNEKAVGNAGNIILQANNAIALTDSAINSIIRPMAIGNGGNITLQAKSISLLDTPFVAMPTRIFSSINAFGEGTGGNIVINADSVSVTALSRSGSHRARITTATDSKGNAGSIFIDVKGAIELFKGDILSEVGINGIGSAGDIIITGAGSLLLNGLNENAARVSTNVRGQGNAGKIFVHADEVTLVNGGAITNNVENNAIGNSDNIIIEVRSLSMNNGGRVEALTRE